MNNKQISKILIIIGMHRSGTSLIANWISHCGLNVGDRLFGRAIGNTTGHYEDLDFLRFHEELLYDNNKDYKIIPSDNLKINDYFRERAKSLVSFKHKLHAQWGWKEPRTCLFLDLWKSIIPTAKPLILYRHYNEVVDSLVRRDIKDLFDRRNKIKSFLNLINYKMRIKEITDIYLKVWIRHNQDILVFLEENEDALIIKTEDIIEKDKQIFHYLNDHWGFDLRFVGIEEIFNKKLLRRNVTISLEKEMKEKAEGLYNQLEVYRDKCNGWL